MSAAKPFHASSDGDDDAMMEKTFSSSSHREASSPSSPSPAASSSATTATTGAFSSSWRSPRVFAVGGDFVMLHPSRRHDLAVLDAVDEKLNLAEELAQSHSDEFVGRIKSRFRSGAGDDDTSDEAGGHDDERDDWWCGDNDDVGGKQQDKNKNNVKALLTAAKKMWSKTIRSIKPPRQQLDTPLQRAMSLAVFGAAVLVALSNSCHAPQVADVGSVGSGIASQVSFWLCATGLRSSLCVDSATIFS